MIHKHWPPVVRVRQEGRWWYVYRKIEQRGREVDDVLAVHVAWERVQEELRKRGYSPAAADASIWERPQLEHGPSRVEQRFTRPSKRYRASGEGPVLARARAWVSRFVPP